MRKILSYSEGIDQAYAYVKNRYKVEHMNCILKKSSRISERKDHKIMTYLSYVYIATIKHIYKFI